MGGLSRLLMVFFFNDTATTEISTLSLPDALPISFAALRSVVSRLAAAPRAQDGVAESVSQVPPLAGWRSSSRVTVRAPLPAWTVDRKSPRRDSSHVQASYAVFCL